jgi:hypothetical protein
MCARIKTRSTAVAAKRFLVPDINKYEELPPPLTLIQVSSTFC